MKEERSQKITLLIAFFVPIFIASLIRFWDIDLRPFHSDEGVNSFFLLNLYNNNYYHYDPSNYHGPFLYYIGLIQYSKGMVRDNWRGRSGNNCYYINSTRKNYLP